MAFSTPATAVADTMLTAGWLNTYVRDNIAWIATDSPACRVYRSTTYSLSDSTPTEIPYDLERFDNAGMHSTTSSTERLTVPTGAGGKYLMGVQLEYAANATGARVSDIWRNGAGIVSLAVSNAGAGIASRPAVSTVYALAAADYISAVGYQSSGNPLNVTASCEAWTFWYRT